MKEQGVEKSNAVSITILGLILLMPIVIEFINVFFYQYGLGSSSNITMIIYGIILGYAIIKTRYFQKADFALLICFYVLFALNYMLYKETREYMVSTEMIIVYIFFLPVGIFIIKNIRNWENFDSIAYPYAVGGVLIALTMMILFDYRKYLSYMEFSYALLPLICILYDNFRYREKRKAVPLLCFLLGTIEMIIFGARAPILFLAMYLCLFEIFRADISLNKKIALIGVFTVIVFVFTISGDRIVIQLSSLPMFSESRIFTKFLSGNLFASITRNTIYENCISRIQTMGLSISGFFGDRAYCGSVYPHNFIYEILMSYGWFFGITMIISIAVLIVRDFVNSNNRIIVLFLLVSIFARYMVSGSYLIEGKFWIFLFALISLSKSKQMKEDVKTYDSTHYIS